jgi:hypothetical protein
VSGLRIAPIKALPPPNNPTGGLAGAQLLREKPASQKRYYPQCFQRLNYFHQNGAAFTLYDTERRPLLDGKRKNIPRSGKSPVQTCFQFVWTQFVAIWLRRQRSRQELTGPCVKDILPIGNRWAGHERRELI